MPAPQNAPEMSAQNNYSQRLEVGPRPSIERQQEKLAPQQEIIAQKQSPASPVLPAPITPANVSKTQNPIVKIPPRVANDNPQTAKDEELIERAWVDKAKAIIARTKNDPYEQEKEVGRLQADYLKKRYGKDVKVTDD